MAEPSSGALVGRDKSQDLTFRDRPVKHGFAKYWDKDYIDEQLNHITNPTHQVLFKTLWMTGIRITEAIQLKKQDLDFTNYVFTVRWLKSRKWLNRVVPMHPQLKPILQLFTAGMKSEDRLFPMTRQNAWQLTQKYFAGNPHQFRHSFAVYWLRSGGDLTTLHRALGHSKLQTTMEYLKIVPVDQGKELIKLQF